MTDFQYIFKEEFDGFQIKHIKNAQKKRRLHVSFEFFTCFINRSENLLHSNWYYFRNVFFIFLQVKKLHK